MSIIDADQREIDALGVDQDALVCTRLRAEIEIVRADRLAKRHPHATNALTDFANGLRDLVSDLSAAEAKLDERIAELSPSYEQEVRAMLPGSGRI